ncbi:MAG: hypothetical protein K6F23_03570 [Solobacterium sp.]|nr:hypothetical protein [Solobacterium sp.]
MSETVTAFDDQFILDLLKNDIQKWTLTPQQTTYLTTLITVAKTEITREGVTLDMTSLDDVQTVAMYAAYLYRKRAEQENGMPRMLRYRLNNRIFAEKTATE